MCEKHKKGREECGVSRRYYLPTAASYKDGLEQAALVFKDGCIVDLSSCDISVAPLPSVDVPLGNVNRKPRTTRNRRLFQMMMRAARLGTDKVCCTVNQELKHMTSRSVRLAECNSCFKGAGL